MDYIDGLTAEETRMAAKHTAAVREMRAWAAKADAAADGADTLDAKPILLTMLSAIGAVKGLPEAAGLACVDAMPQWFHIARAPMTTLTGEHLRRMADDLRALADAEEAVSNRVVGVWRRGRDA